MLTVSSPGRVRVGRADSRLTSSAGLAAVAEVDRVIGLSGLLEAGIGQVKKRDRGASGAQALLAMACAQLAGEDHLVGLDRRRADAAGQELAPVADVPSTTAAQIAARFTPEAFWGLEEAVAVAAGRVLDLLPAARRARLTRTVTLDVDATEIEVFGRKKEGAKHGHTGALRYQADIVHWAELGVPLVADLLDGTEDPRAGVVDRLTRAVHVLPVADCEIRARLDTGYFAIDVARACVQMGVRFAIGVRRNQAVLRDVLTIDESAWHDAAGMPGSQVAVMNYLPGVWAKDPDIARDKKQTPIACLVRRTRIEAADLPTERARRRKRAHPEQLQLALDGVIDHVYLYSFILTNLETATSDDVVAVEHWYRHRTDIEALNRDAKHGAAARHAPSGKKTVNRVWLAAALTACAISAFTTLLAGLHHPDGTGRATITRLRRELIRVPARVRRARDGTTWLHPPPGFSLLNTTLTRLQALPTAVG
ncbi:hypothetical protein GCM10027059_50860 [Myceligenerans halotolerans]